MSEEAKYKVEYEGVKKHVKTLTSIVDNINVHIQKLENERKLANKKLKSLRKRLGSLNKLVPPPGEGEGDCFAYQPVTPIVMENPECDCDWYGTGEGWETCPVHKDK